MKKIILLLILMGIFTSLSAQTTFDVRLRNDIQVTDKIYEFDVYFINTGSAQIELNTVQLGIKYNTAVNNGGTISLSMVPGSSQMAAAQQPTSFGNLNGVLTVGPKGPVGVGNGTTISSSGFGIKFARLRITNTVTFGAATMDLVFNVSGVGYQTKIFAYVAGSSTSTNVTSNGTFLTSDLGNAPLPVHLASFNGNVLNQRDVKLTWKTATETNNYGFDIERKALNGQWSKVAFVNGKGNSTTTVNYEYQDTKLNTGKYNYRLKQIDNNGNYEYFDLSGTLEVGIPNKYNIGQNYPNPFNPTTKIDFDLPKDSKINITIYDLTGKEIKTLINEYRSAGYYTVTFDASGISSGTYFYRMTTDGDKSYVVTKKLVVVK